MHLVLTGASGLIGSATLHAMIRNPSITKISIFTRRPLAQATDTPEAKAKCNVLQHPDFAKPPSDDVLSQLKGARGCVWALGISVNDVDAKKYQEITIDYTMTFAKAFATAGLGDQGFFNFIYVSGEGATLTPGILTPRFGVVKGRAEAALLALSKEEQYKSLKVYSARPAAVDRIGHTEIAPYMDGRPEGFAKKLEKPVLVAIRAVWKSFISPTKPLGDALVQLAAGDGERLPDGPGISGEGRTVANVALRRMAGI